MYMRNTGPKAMPLPRGKVWLSAPGPNDADLAQMGTAIEVLKLGPQNPQYVLGRLRSATNVREAGAASGPGWTGHRYSFTIADTKNVKRPGLSLSGTVSVDSEGLVRVLDLNVRTGGPGRPQHSVVEFGDYGVRVDVTAPPAGQTISVDKVEQPRTTGGRPGKGSPSPRP
jgi:hypothetical protein